MMPQIFPPVGNPNPGVPSFQDFQTALDLMNRQHQQEMWKKMLYEKYLFFCQTRGLNIYDNNNLKLFYQQNIGGNTFPQQQIQPGFMPNGFGQPQIQPSFPKTVIPNGFHQPPMQNGFSQQKIQTNINPPKKLNSFNQTKLNTSYPQPQVKINTYNRFNSTPSFSNSNKNINDNGSNVYVRDGIRELIPRGERDIYCEPENKNDPYLMNIYFKVSTGLNMLMPTPANTTIRTLLEKYMAKLNLPLNYLGKEIQFLFNGQIISPYSNKLIGNEFKNNVVITVFDQGSVIGAF